MRRGLGIGAAMVTAGMLIGGVTAFGLPDGIPVWIDARVLTRRRVWLGGGLYAPDSSQLQKVRAFFGRYACIIYKSIPASKTLPHKLY